MVAPDRSPSPDPNTLAECFLGASTLAQLVEWGTGQDFAISDLAEQLDLLLRDANANRTVQVWCAVMLGNAVIRSIDDPAERAAGLEAIGDVFGLGLSEARVN